MIAWIQLAESGLTTLYGVCWSKDMQPGDVSSAGSEEYVTYNADNYANYAISAIEIGSTAKYVVSVPEALQANLSHVEWQIRSGATAVEDDSSEGVSARAQVDVATVKGVDADTVVANAVVAIEAAIVDDATGEAVKQAIIDKLVENLPDLDDLSLAAIAQAVWDRLLTVIVADGSIGKLIKENLDAKITSRHASGAAVAKSPATFDWIDDVANKPMIGTSTFDPETQGVSLTEGERTTLAGTIVDAFWAATSRLSAYITSIRSAIWSGANRTLSGSATGLGPTAAHSQAAAHFTCSAGGTCGIYFRLQNWGGDDLTRAEVSSISYTIFSIGDDGRTLGEPLEGHADMDLTIADVLSDEVHSDGWASDWNFKHIPDVSEHAAFPTLRQTYLVRYEIQLQQGQAIVYAPRVTAV